MKLYLVRHGEARDKFEDPTRPLTEKGEQAIQRLAVNLGQRNIEVDWCWHSGIKRAEQTARLLADQISYGLSLEEEPDLVPEADVIPIAQRLNSIELDGMVVGHLPFLGILAAHLLSADESAPIINFAPGTVYCLERDAKNHWHFCWKLDP